jgi:hypothetical protein
VNVVSIAASATTVASRIPERPCRGVADGVMPTFFPSRRRAIRRRCGVVRTSRGYCAAVRWTPVLHDQRP